MAIIEILSGLTQAEYERLLSSLAGAIGTQRKFVSIVSAERVSITKTRYTVKYKKSYYPCLVEEIFTSCGNIYLNLGLVI